MSSFCSKCSYNDLLLTEILQSHELEEKVIYQTINIKNSSPQLEKYRPKQVPTIIVEHNHKEVLRLNGIQSSSTLEKLISLSLDLEETQ